MEIDLPDSVLEELQKVWKQQWKKLTLADDFIFSRIMQNTEVCKEVLELLLKIKISHYEPHSYIDPNNQHPYDDKTKKIFYNVSRYQDVDDPRIKDFLQYLKNKTPTNDFTRRLDQMVEELKTIEVGFTDYIAARQKEFDWLRQGKEQGYEAGLQQGLERGAHQKALETAKKLIARGYELEDIADLSGLTISQIQELLPS